MAEINIKYTVKFYVNNCECNFEWAAGKIENFYEEKIVNFIKLKFMINNCTN